MEELILSRLIYLINNDRSKDIGLFTGKSGWCLALYVYAFKRRDKKILAIAETIFLLKNKSKKPQTTHLKKKNLKEKAEEKLNHFHQWLLVHLHFV